MRNRSGTTSSRFIIFDRKEALSLHFNLNTGRYIPSQSWVEHDAEEIWENFSGNIRLLSRPISSSELSAIGITNQRETVVAWNRYTGRPYHNAIVWQDTRTENEVERLKSSHGIDFYRNKTGLPLSTYFSASKFRWLLSNVPGLNEAAVSGDAVFGTADSWILYKLTNGGGRRGEVFTEVTNASRTFLMNIETLAWDRELLDVFSVPPDSLPEIRASVPHSPFGYTAEDGPFKASLPVFGMLGDQQAALFGQACFREGESKNTYGTGCFMLMNTGERIVHSRHGLLTTLAFRIGDRNAYYATEGSVAVAGALVQWLRDNLGLIKSSGEIEELARKAEDSGGVYFVPAFSGLLHRTGNQTREG